MSQKFQTISPINNSIYLEREFASPTQIEQVLSNAKKAYREWRKTSIAERAKICQNVVTYFLNNSEQIAEELTWQMGRPIKYSPFEITKGFKERAEFMISIAAENLSDIQVSKKEGFERFIRREPLGTVLVLAPWNYPYLTSVNAIIPAIMAGNTVILKHAIQTPLCAERYDQAFVSAGAPKGLFQYLHVTHEDVSNIIRDERIDFVSFTGSVAGGAAVQNALSHRFIGAGLELGGKDPAYVRIDADLSNAVENLVDGTFFNSGQSCCGIERIYVHESLFAEFVDQFVALTKTYQLGNPLLDNTTLGPMVKSSAAAFVQRQIDQAIAAGAKTCIIPKSFEMHDPNTAYMAPQVLINVDHNMDIMKEESFGPVVGIMSVKNDEQAIQLMNDSKYGLTASVWTQDISAAKSIGDKVNSGTFFMNRCDYLDPELAWTGIKNSGRGCTLSALGYTSLTRPKSFHLKG